MKFSRIFIFILMGSWICNLITAIRSVGYIGFDEMFQTIEFGASQIGLVSTQNLPWEYAKKIRPWLQPSIFAVSMKFLYFIGIKNRFSLYTFLRIESMLFSFFSYSFLAWSYKKIYSQKQVNWIFVSLFFFWPILLLNSRTSSENFSAASLALSLAFINNSIINKNNRIIYFLCFFSGIFASCAFQFRYQVAFFILGSFVWMLYFTKQKIKRGVSFCLGFLILLFFCILLDSKYYGEFNLTFWKYFSVNILQGIANNFGKENWYYYVKEMNSFLKIDIFIPFIVFLLYSAYKNYRSLLVWSIVPFVVVHFIIAHKEFRFLFPVLPFFTILVAIELPNSKLIFFNFLKKIHSKLYLANFIRLLVILIVMIFITHNFLFILQNMTIPFNKNLNNLEFLLNSTSDYYGNQFDIRYAINHNNKHELYYNFLIDKPFNFNQVTFSENFIKTHQKQNLYILLYNEQMLTTNILLRSGCNLVNVNIF